MIGAFLVSLLGSLAMWWLYFATTADVASERLSKSHNPGGLARLAYTYIHILLVAGITLSAVGDAFTLVHPVVPTDAKTAIAVLGGTAIYLIGNLLFKWTVIGKTGYSNIATFAALGVLAFYADSLTPLVVMTTTSLVLVVAVIMEERSRLGAIADACAYPPCNRCTLRSAIHLSRRPTQ